MDMNRSTAVAFLFAGQGNPTIGMGSDLWDISDAARQIWDCASDITGVDIRRLCLKGPMNKLVQTPLQQVAVTAINVTLYALCRAKMGDIHAVAACGHSVGEYAALYAADAITLDDLFRVIHFRSTLMNDLSKTHKGAMQAVRGVDSVKMLDFIARTGGELDLSCDNSQRQQVIGGSLSALRKGTRALIEGGYETIKLGVSGAWHTRLMADGVQPMRDFLAGVEIKVPQYDVLMNVSGEPEASPEAIKENLSLHLTHTVQWKASMDNLLGQTSRLQFIEISNKAYLGQMLNDFAAFTPGMALHCRKICISE